MLVVSNASLGNDPIKPSMVVRTASCTRGFAVAVNFEINSDGLICDTTCMYGFFANKSPPSPLLPPVVLVSLLFVLPAADRIIDPSVPNSADEVAELTVLDDAVGDDDGVRFPLPLLLVLLLFVLSSVPVVLLSLTTSFLSKFVSLSKEIGKLVSLMYSLARFKLSDSSNRWGSKKSPRPSSSSPPLPLLLLLLLFDGGRGGSLPPPIDDQRQLVVVVVVLVKEEEDEVVYDDGDNGRCRVDDIKYLPSASW